MYYSHLCICNVVTNNSIQGSLASLNSVSKAIHHSTSRPLRMFPLPPTNLTHKHNWNINILTPSLKPPNLWRVPFFKNMRIPHVPTNLCQFTISKSDAVICSTFPVLLFLKIMCWSVNFSRPGHWKYIKTSIFVMFYHKVSLNCSQSHSSEQPMLATTLQIKSWQV